MAGFPLLPSRPLTPVYGAFWIGFPPYLGVSLFTLIFLLRSYCNQTSPRVIISAILLQFNRLSSDQFFDLFCRFFLRLCCGMSIDVHGGAGPRMSCPALNRIHWHTHFHQCVE